MSTTYSPLSDADDSENQLAQLIKDVQELKNTVREQNAIILKLEEKDEINELKNNNHQELATSLKSPENQMEIMDLPLDSPSQNITPENVNESHQPNDGKPYSYYRKPCTLVYISYGCRLVFICLVLDRSGMLRSLTSLLLLLSVVPLFSRRHENENLILYCIRIVGWLVNLGGAIVLFSKGNSIYDSYYFDVNQLISFGLLAYGHFVELVHLLLLTKRLEYKAYIVSLSCCIAGFLLRIISENMILYIAGSTLLAVHAFAQYIAIFYETPPPGVPTPPPGVPVYDDTVQQDSEPLSDDMLDSFTFMMVSDDIKVWNFGFLIFVLQLSLVAMILIDQVIFRGTSIPFDAPIIVDLNVTLAQFFGLFLCTFWQSDIITSIKVLDMFWFKKENVNEWPYKEIHAKDSIFWTWLDKVFLPNALRFLVGFLVLGTSFVIIVKSDNTIDLFKDFTALILTSQIDNIAFSLAHQCYFGDKLKDESDRIKRIRVNDTSHYRIYRIPIRLFAVLVISSGVFGGWAYFVHGQRSGTFFLWEYKRKYPKCDVEYPTLIGDKTCHGGAYNTVQCGFDDGDCTNFNMRYPGCTVEDPTLIGDESCDGGAYNTVQCGFDGGDCFDLGKYPKCDVKSLSFVGDGECDGGEYNTPECGFDGGDCCDVKYPSLIGDGKCDGGEYNTPECGFDGGDCDTFNRLFPDCYAENPFYIGNKKCDGGDYNREECGFDGGDCEKFNELYPDCDVKSPSEVGDEDCHGGEYNTAKCGFDGGDCFEFNELYPDCDVRVPSVVGDGYCDGEEYNTAKCGFDGGDCPTSSPTWSPTTLSPTPWSQTLLPS